MLSSYLLMQNSLFALNNIQSNMFQNADMMGKSIGFGNSLPLKPIQEDSFELQNKANETKISVLNNLISALEKKQSNDIAKSTPKYAGLNYKA